MTGERRTTSGEQWREALTHNDQGLVYWALSSLMVAEERITTKFSGLVGADASEEEIARLTEQCQACDRHYRMLLAYFSWR